jgi:Zn-dependent protease/predicted transcriptional regulator
MKWSWKLGEVSGISIYMHATFMILLAWVAWSYWQREHSLIMVLIGIGFILALFGCVVLHELGHALMARKFGIPTRDITLLPIGGVARLERMPEEPKQEMLVALAGPAVNLVIAALLFVLLRPDLGVLLRQLSVSDGPSLGRLMVVNVFLVLFNMLPAFPMDGGRVLRALLAQRIEYVRATQVAASIGQGMAFLFGFLGLLYNPFLLFIALFIYMGAAQEATMAQMHTAFRGIPVKNAMVTNFRTLSKNDSLSQALANLLSGCQQDFPVLDQGAVVGVLTRSALLTALAEKGMNALVIEAMHSNLGTADESEMLESIFHRMQQCGCSALPVVRGGSLVGMITLENIGEFMMVQTAMQKSVKRKVSASS